MMNYKKYAAAMLALSLCLTCSCGKEDIKETADSSAENSVVTTVSESVEDETTDVSVEPEVTEETLESDELNSEEFIEVLQNVKNFSDGEYQEIEGLDFPCWWNNYSSFVGNLSEDELREWSIFFAQNDFEHRLLLNEFDNPSSVDLKTLFYGVSDREWTQDEIDNSDFDVMVYTIDEVNTKLNKVFGMSNDEFDAPLTFQNLNGKDCIVCSVSGGSDSVYSNFYGGYLENDVYTLAFPGRIVQFSKTDDGIKLIKCLNTDTTSYNGHSFYYPNELYSDGNINKLNEKSRTEVDLVKKEYYARHGMIFEDPIINLYFESMSWYSGSIAEADFKTDVFNSFETENMNTIDSILETK